MEDERIVSFFAGTGIWTPFLPLRNSTVFLKAKSPLCSTE